MEQNYSSLENEFNAFKKSPAAPKIKDGKTDFNKEVEDAKAKDAGKKKNDEIATGAVQSVKNEETHTTVEVIDFDPINGVQRSEIDLSEDAEQVDERHMTEPEMKKREEIVKSMKKGIAGFKERYGDRAKEVMYATATKQAMKD